MVKWLIIIAAVAAVAWYAAAYRPGPLQEDGKEKKPVKKYDVEMTEAEWKEKLTPEEYYILRQKGTERAFSGDLYKHKAEGIYTCAGCGNQLFDSDTKYESGSGWPSFFKPLAEANVEELSDTTHGMVRTEVLCNACGGHLGHVFPDGPAPTRLRYCINSASLDFVAESDDQKKE